MTLTQSKHEIMGPYGSPLAMVGDHSHALVVGCGTGKTWGPKYLNCASLLSTPNRQTLTQRIYCEYIIGFVPCLSLLQQHIEKCISLDPHQYDCHQRHIGYNTIEHHDLLFYFLYFHLDIPEERPSSSERLRLLVRILKVADLE